MPEADSGWLTLLLGPSGLLVGALGLVWALATERLVSGTMHRREIARERAKNEALLKLLSKATHVTGTAVEAVSPSERTRD